MKKLILFFLTCTLTGVINAQSIEAAKKEICKENFFKAKTILNDLLKTPGASLGDVYYYLGNAYLNSEDPDSAKLMYLNSSNANPKSAIGYLALGRVSLLNKNNSEAKSNFDRALQTSRFKNANIFFEVGDAWFKPNIIDLKEAIIQLEEACKLDGKNTTSLLTLGDAYLAQKDNTQAAGMALSKYESAAEIDKNSGEAFQKIARINFRGRIYDEAIKNYEQAVKIDPTNAIAFKELGEAYYWIRNYEKMVENFKKYNDLMPGDIEAKTKLAAFYFQNKEYEKCLEECSKGMATEPNNFYFLRMVAFSNFELKRYKDGYEATKKFWSVPNAKVKPIDYAYSAKLATENGDTSKAFEYYRVALQNDSTNCDLLSGYAKTLSRAKRYVESVKVLNSKLSTCSLTTLDYFDLGKSQYFSADYLNADKSFETFISRTPSTPDGYFWRAKSNLRMETESNTGLALPHYQKFIEMVSADPTKNKKNLIEAYNYMGAYFSGKNDKNSAKSYFSKVLELDPADPIATELMKGL